MTALTVEELYGPYINVASKEVVCDAQRLMQVTSDSVVTSVVVQEGAHSLLELEGLGKEIWEGVDPKRYIDDLRDEWHSR